MTRLKMRRATVACFFVCWTAAATASFATTSNVVEAHCLAGCPHMLDLVCGVDHNTYQSRCLALCQGIQVLNDGSCVEPWTVRDGKRRLDLARILSNIPLNILRPSQQYEVLEADDPILKRQSRRRALSARRRAGSADIHLFRSEGFRLLGIVDMKAIADIVPEASNDPVQQDEYTDWDIDSRPASQQSVRALRITREGLLYAARYDLDALSAAVQAASGSGSSGIPFSKTSESYSESHSSAHQSHKLREYVNTESKDDVDLCGTLPGLPYFDPSAKDRMHSLFEKRSEQEDETLEQREPSDMRLQSKQRQEGQRSQQLYLETGRKHYQPELHASQQQQQQQQVHHAPQRSGALWAAASQAHRLLQSVSRYLSPLQANNNATQPPAPPVATPTVVSPGNATVQEDGVVSTSSSSAVLTVANMSICPSSAFPYTAIGQLELQDSTGAYVCSGSLVGADAVLTAAHCVFRRDGLGGGDFYSELNFAAGRYNTQNRTYNPFNITSWAFATIFDTYELVSDSYIFDWDVAIIRLSAAVGNSAGWLGIASGCPVSAATGLAVQNYAVATAGYPAALPFGACNTMNCSIIMDTCSTTAYHTCTSLSGQSGSPFFMQRDFRVRGILVGTIPAASAPLKVTHIVGTASYSAIVSWIAETLPDALADDDSMTAYVSPPSPPSLPSPLSPPLPSSPEPSPSAATASPPPSAPRPPPPSPPTNATSNATVTTMDGKLSPVPAPSPQKNNISPTYPPAAHTLAAVDTQLASVALHKQEDGRREQSSGVYPVVDTSAAASSPPPWPAPATGDGAQKAKKWVRRTRTHGRRLSSTSAQGTQQTI